MEKEKENALYVLGNDLLTTKRCSSEYENKDLIRAVFLAGILFIILEYNQDSPAKVTVKGLIIPLLMIIIFT